MSGCCFTEIDCSDILDEILSKGKLTIFMILYGCGEHLLACEKFHCDRKYFKCPGFYCIPRRNMCNMIWDCPGGLDEIECSSRHSCPSQFKCHDSIICINVDSVCDGNPDCQNSDDEWMCSIPDCPRLCKCLLYGIMCVFES